MRNVDIKTATTLYLPYDMHRVLKLLAKQNDTTINKLIVSYIDKIFEQNKVKYNKLAFNGDKLIKI